jgi:hypothetical protein
MAAVRPTVNVRGVDGAASGSLTLPAVFTAPIRTDVVEAIHSAFEIQEENDDKLLMTLALLSHRGHGKEQATTLCSLG